MKKFLLSILCIGIACTLILTSCAKKKTTEQQEEPKKDTEIVEIVVPEIPFEYDYSMEGDGAIIYAYTGNQTEVVIPAEVMDPNTGDMLTVTELGENLFFSNIEVESIVVPEGVTYIGPGCFQNCKNLKSVSLPSTLKEIGARAFIASDAITDMTIPASVEKIGLMAFSSLNYSMPWVKTLSGNPVIVGDGILLSYKGSGNVTFGPEVKHIAYYAFANSAVKNVTFSSALESIDSNAFIGCDAKIRLADNCPALDTIKGIDYETYTPAN